METIGSGVVVIGINLIVWAEAAKIAGSGFQAREENIEARVGVGDEVRGDLERDGFGETLTGDRDEIGQAIEVEGDAAIVLALAGAMGLKDHLLDVLPAIVNAGNGIEGFEPIGMGFANAQQEAGGKGDAQFAREF